MPRLALGTVTLIAKSGPLLIVYLLLVAPGGFVVDGVWMMPAPLFFFVRAEQGADRLIVVDAFDGFGQQGGDAEHFDS